MAPSTSTQDFFGRTRTAMTATAVAAMLVFTGESILPSRYYELESPPPSGYQWEIRGTYGVTSEPTSAVDEFEMIQHFVATIASRSKDLDSRYDQIISDNFWELI